MLFVLCLISVSQDSNYYNAQTHRHCDKYSIINTQQLYLKTLQYFPLYTQIKYNILPFSLFFIGIFFSIALNGVFPYTIHALCCHSLRQKRYSWYISKYCIVSRSIAILVVGQHIYQLWLRSDGDRLDELSVRGALSSSNTILNGMSFSKQYSRTSGIKQFRNHSSNSACDIHDLRWWRKQTGSVAWFTFLNARVFKIINSERLQLTDLMRNKWEKIWIGSSWLKLIENIIYNQKKRKIINKGITWIKIHNFAEITLQIPTKSLYYDLWRQYYNSPDNFITQWLPIVILNAVVLLIWRIFMY